MSEPTMEKGFFDIHSETMPWEDRKELLEEKLRAIFSHAYENSVAYREIYEKRGIFPSDIKGLDDLESLPLIRTGELVERQHRKMPFGGFETIRSENMKRIYVNSGPIWQPGEKDFQDTTWAEALCGTGLGPGDLVINTFNYHMWPVGFMLDESLHMIGATVIPTGTGNTLMQAKIMQALKINAFMGTPSFLMTLAQRTEAMGLDVREDLHLEKAVVSAEMLPESLRSRIEGIFEIEIRQIYGTALLGCIGYECRYKKGLHVPDNIIVEIVDPDTGGAVERGQAGEIVVTNFNRAFPMIRMATGDLSVSSTHQCPCGRTSPLLTRILGRIDQATKVKGTFIHPWQVDEIISHYPEIFKYQVVITRQDHKDLMAFVVELKEGIGKPDAVRRNLERDVREMLAVKGAVKIVKRGSIPDMHKKIEDRRSWD
ncbi:MAG: AMP-binding protein [Deltaproteobacteria bacterium]|nr:AMP-binding protein [Deltaproteobacteria bacterium]